MSRTFRLDKLVRDGIVPSMEAQGQKPDFVMLDEPQRISELPKKMVEEAGEMDLADMLQVIEDWAIAEGKTFDDIRQEQLDKYTKMGGFAAGYFVRTVTVEDDDPWADYYAAEPERFPEE